MMNKIIKNNLKLTVKLFKDKSQRKCTDQGNKIRELKGAKAAKDVIMKEVETLKGRLTFYKIT